MSPSHQITLNWQVKYCIQEPRKTPFSFLRYIGKNLSARVSSYMKSKQCKQGAASSQVKGKIGNSPLWKKSPQIGLLLDTEPHELLYWITYGHFHTVCRYNYS